VVTVSLTFVQGLKKNQSIIPAIREELIMDRFCLYVVLTRTNTVISRAIHWIKKDNYTHAAISLDEGLTQMYGFGRRKPYNPFIGCFRKEDISEGVYGICRTLPGAIIEFEVTPQQYAKAQEIVEHFLVNKENYKYNYQGLLFGLLNKPMAAGNSFLCSEFVYYVLNECGVLDLNMPRSLIRLQKFLQGQGKVVFQGDLKALRPSSLPFAPIYMLKTFLQLSR